MLQTGDIYSQVFALRQVGKNKVYSDIYNQIIIKLWFEIKDHKISSLVCPELVEGGGPIHKTRSFHKKTHENCA